MASHSTDAPLPAIVGEPDQSWLKARLEELERIYRPSASDGERLAAEWLVDQFRELGARARIEAADAHGTYWWPLGIGAALGGLGGLPAAAPAAAPPSALSAPPGSPPTSRPTSAACARRCPSAPPTTSSARSAIR